MHENKLPPRLKENNSVENKIIQFPSITSRIVDHFPIVSHLCCSNSNETGYCMHIVNISLLTIVKTKLILYEFSFMLQTFIKQK